MAASPSIARLRLNGGQQIAHRGLSMSCGVCDVYLSTATGLAIVWGIVIEKIEGRRLEEQRRSLQLHHTERKRAACHP